MVRPLKRTMDQWDRGTPHGPALLFTQAQVSWGLPVLAETQQLVAAHLDGSELGLIRAADLVAQDPALCVNVLHAASQSEGPNPYPLRIGEVVVRVLGTRGLQQVLDRTEVLRGLGDRPRLNLQHLREHSLNVALLARFHARAAGADSDLAYLAGLLHDTGTLAVARHLPESLRALLDLAGADHSLDATCLAQGFAPPLRWTVALLEHLAVPAALPRLLMAVDSSDWPFADPLANAREAIHRAHRLCEVRKSASAWDRWPELHPALSENALARAAQHAEQLEFYAALH